MTTPAAARSRSPRRENDPGLVLAGSSSSRLRSFDLDRMELTLDEHVVKVRRFADDPEMPWFQAKPIVTFLGYRNVTSTMEDHVYPEDKRSLQELIDTKGTPLGGGSSQLTPFGYNDLKATHINEPALYSLIFGSRKPEAKEFKRWVCTVVLPGIRRTGSYGALQLNFNTLQLALQERDKQFQLALQERDEQFQLALQQRDEQFRLALQQRDEELAAQNARHVAAVAQLETSILAALATRFGNQLLSLGGHFQTVVVAAVKAGLNLKKSQAKRRSVNAQHLPEDQRGTTRQAGPLALSLSSVAVEILSELCYAAWLKIRGAFGQHAMAERLRRHSLGPQHPEYVAQPKLWSYTGAVEGGGARRLYLLADRALLRAVFLAQRTTSAQQRAEGAPTPSESLAQRAQRFQASMTQAEREVPWPEHASGLEPAWDEV